MSDLSGKNKSRITDVSDLMTHTKESHNQHTAEERLRAFVKLMARRAAEEDFQTSDDTCRTDLSDRGDKT